MTKFRRLSLYFSGERGERWAQYGIILLVLYASARGIVAAFSKPFWYDEIFTLVMARQPTLGMMWNALRQGVDSQPPLFDLIERATRLIPNAEIGFRLPSILGFACVLICLYVFVRRRSRAIYGLVAAGTAMLTFLYMPYAVEARPYSLVAACVALGLVAYQRAGSSLRWTAVLALALTIAENLHYYSIFALIPFGIAEAVYSWQTSKIRWRIWVALALGASPLIALWQLLSRFRAIYGMSFWAQPNRATVLHFYGDFLQISFFWGLAVSIVCGLAVLGVLRFGPDKSGEASGSLLHERVLVFALLATPLIVFVVTKLLHGGYTERYALYSVLGIALAVGLVLPRLGYRTRILAPGFLLLALIVNEASFWLSRANPPGHLESPATAAEQMVDGTIYDNLPVVVTNTHEYLQIAYYAPPDLASRLVSVVDPRAAVRYSASDGDDKALEQLADYSPLRIYDFQSFHSYYSSFLLYADSSEPLGWWPQRLVDDGYVLRVVASAGEELVFLVTPPERRPERGGR